MVFMIMVFVGRQYFDSAITLPKIMSIKSDRNKPLHLHKVFQKALNIIQASEVMSTIFDEAIKTTKTDQEI